MASTDSTVVFFVFQYPLVRQVRPVRHCHCIFRFSISLSRIFPCTPSTASTHCRCIFRFSISLSTPSTASTALSCIFCFSISVSTLSMASTTVSLYFSFFNIPPVRQERLVRHCHCSFGFLTTLRTTKWLYFFSALVSSTLIELRMNWRKPIKGDLKKTRETFK